MAMILIWELLLQLHVLAQLGRNKNIEVKWKNLVAKKIGLPINPDIG